MLRLVGLFLCLALSATLASADITFGPAPRALDNAAGFDARDPLRRAEWTALKKSGVTVIDLNPTFVMRVELARASEGGTLLPRYPGTYLDDADLANLRARVAEGFTLNYEAGIALSADRCAIGDPAKLGVAAARAEYTHVVSLLHRADIPVAEISIDGPFLRLVQGSQKGFSCASGTRNRAGQRLSDGAEGKSRAFAAAAVHAYIEELTAQIAARQSRPPAVSLTINLPNWREGRLASANWPDLQTSISDMLVSFAAHRQGAGQLVTWIRIDYPACYLAGTARCGGGTADTFAAKMAALWRASRGVNGTRPPPAFAVIANDTGGRVACMPPQAIPLFLAYRNYRDQSITRDSPAPAPDAYTTPDRACQIAQRDGPDRQFINRSFAYAQSLTKGPLAARLRQADPSLKISRIAFQSWGISPMSNLWYIGQIRRYAEQQ